MRSDGHLPHVTLRDVARKAGVSVGTASNVFTHKAPVSPGVQAAVSEAAQELAYRHRPRTTTHRQAPSPILGLISQRAGVATSSNHFYGPVLHGVEQACAARGAGLMYAVVDQGASGEEELPVMVQRRHVQGLLLLSYIVPHTLAALQRTRLPMVLIDHHVDVPEMDSVMGDDERGSYLATMTLIEHGHRDPAPALIYGPPHVSVQRRVAGYRSALCDAGLRFDESYARAGQLDAASGYTAMTALLDRTRPPTAVFCCNDAMALGALNALHQRGVAVPEQCSVVGYDNIDLAAHSVPPLTTVNVDKALLGGQAVRYLLERLEEPRLTARHTRLAVSLVERRSVASFRPAGALASSDGLPTTGGHAASSAERTITSGG